MNQQYPGDIAPLMRACADLAQRRANDLARVRASVTKLKSNLAHTLVQFDQARSVSSTRVQALRVQTTRTLSEGRRARSVQLAGLRARFAKDHARTSEQTRKALGSFRAGLQAAVGAIKQQTQIAKRARFKSGSLHRAVPPISKENSRVAPSAIPAESIQTRAKRSDLRSFLDL